MRMILLAAAAVALAACGSKADVAEATPADASAPETDETEVSPAPPSAAPAAAAADSAAAQKWDLPPPAWNVDTTKSRLTFTGTQTGKEFAGSFSKFAATIIFDPNNLPDSSIEVVVDMASAKTGDRQRDDALPSKDWFAVAQFPTATFTSSEIVEKGANAYEAKGILKIRDAAKDVAAPFTLTITDRAVADGTATLVRSDFGVGQGEFATGEWVGLDVKVSFHIEARR